MVAQPLRTGPSTRLRTGIFMAPFHRAGENPTLSLQRDLELIQWLDANRIAARRD